MFIKFSKKDFLKLGIALAGNWSDEQVKRMGLTCKLGHFTDRFYADPKTMKEIFRDIQHPDLGEHCIKKPDPIDFLGAFHFLKKYPTKQTQAGFVACSVVKWTTIALVTQMA